MSIVGMIALTAVLFGSIGFIGGCVWASLPWQDEPEEPPLGIG